MFKSLGSFIFWMVAKNIVEVVILTVFLGIKRWGEKAFN